MWFTRAGEMQGAEDEGDSCYSQRPCRLCSEWCKCKAASARPIGAYYTLSVRFARACEMQGAEDEGDRSVLWYMTKPEFRKQRSRSSAIANRKKDQP
ncbi:MAG: hypothetical protein ACI3Y2_06560 [Candidatus Egerieousia sp.]